MGARVEEAGWDGDIVCVCVCVCVCVGGCGFVGVGLCVCVCPCPCPCLCLWLGLGLGLGLGLCMRVCVCVCLSLVFINMLVSPPRLFPPVRPALAAFAIMFVGGLTLKMCLSRCPCFCLCLLLRLNVSVSLCGVGGDICGWCVFSCVWQAVGTDERMLEPITQALNDCEIPVLPV